MKTSTRISAVVAVLLFVALLLCIQIAGSSDAKHAPPRVMMEIKGMEAAVESYRADHEGYPSDPAATERLATNTTGDPAAYVSSSEFLYRALSGDIDGKRYYDFKPEMLRRSPAGRLYIVDPAGNSYGYSTFKAVHPESPDGNNPTFDLWSTNGHTRVEDGSYWCRNW